ncbi:DUF4179 domain-containing protein [Tepidanaerobacter syntrophicus]|uniref:DUF4179 domain-containing protein n=1 Tax=Tepidanaerobacter syntrophicus TaxID=224999 RepID=A0A0U9HFQ1_9FIRM|nr:DUF4179 domain-containing protein [Tepidanaerobacter syntrophicus]GAQ25666.1 hypothetical protein TSYNT_8203 [Tepidanaerobacter syntrophicus]
MNYKDLDKIKVSSRLDDTIRFAIEEGYSKRAKTKKRGLKKHIAAAAAALIIGTTAFGMAFPTQAKEIPIIGNVFAYLSEYAHGNYAEYKDFSKSLDMACEDKDVKITLNDAIYDGTTVMVTYTLESEKDLGDDIYIRDDLDIKGYFGGMTGSSGIYKVNENTYIGFMRMTMDKVFDELDVRLKFDNITNHKDLDIKGKWAFNFNIKKTDTDILVANKGVTKDGATVKIDKITFTPMSTIIHYSQQVPEEAIKGYFGAYTSLVEVKDDLGNVYSGEGNGGSGTKNLMKFSSTYGKIDKDATKLIITPKVEFEVLGEDGHRIIGPSILKSDEKEVLDYLKQKGTLPKEVFLDDIVIDLK